jgi:hypothetical protein
MRIETAISLKNRTDKHVAKMLNRRLLKVRHKRQRENSWIPQENTDFIDTIVRGWICTPIYTIQEIDEEDGELIDCVFDGAHKIEAVINYIDNLYALKSINELSPLNGQSDKKFKDLPKDIQQKILNYEFNVNEIDTEIADDKDSLKFLWERLNKAGRKLNSYELAIPVLQDLIKLVLTPCLPLFINSQIFTKETSSRGAAEKLMQMILATSDSPLSDTHLANFSSKVNLVKKWQNERLGQKISDIKLNTEKNTEKWNLILKTASQYMKALHEANCFVDDEGKDILKPAHRGTELVFLLGRLVYHFKKPEEFRRICPALAKKAKEQFFSEIIRTAPGRNGMLQKSLLSDIDKLVLEFVERKTPRVFTKDQIAIKLGEQTGLCGLCSEPIFPHHKYTGDHIIPYSLGGETTLENCQVTHVKCNGIKGDRINLNTIKKK